MDNENNVPIKSLAKFSLAFEYDKTWHEAKKAVKSRAVKE